MQQAPPGAPHDKLTSNYPFALGSRGFATRPDLCLSPASHGSKASEWPMSLVCHDLCHAGAIFSRRSVRVLRAAFRRVVGGGLVELAVERRAADFKAPRNLRHLPSIMRNRKADDFVFHVLEWPHLAGGGQHREATGIRERRDWYFT